MGNFLLSHQIKFASGYKDKALLAHEGGSGKTICACVWLHDKRDNDALVVCPKKVVRKWQNELKKWQTKATVVSKENYKNLPLKEWSARVIDEADEFGSALFIKGTSALSKKLYEQVKTYPDTPTLLLTATPVRSTPYNLHSLLCYMNKYIDWKLWRQTFFDLKYPSELRYLTRPSYIPKSDWREKIQIQLKKYADIVNLRDITDLPPLIEEKILVKTPKYAKLPEATVFYDEHRWEQQNKIKEILEIGKEYSKIIVVAYYVEQVELLRKELSKDRKTFVIYGKVKDQELIAEEANKFEGECFFIIQASCGSAFDADNFSCMIYASMSYAVRDFVQMNFRVRRIHNLHPVMRYYLVAGRCDKAILANVEAGKSFVPSEWKK